MMQSCLLIILFTIAINPINCSASQNSGEEINSTESVNSRDKFHRNPFMVLEGQIPARKAGPLQALEGILNAMISVDFYEFQSFLPQCDKGLRGVRNLSSINIFLLEDDGLQASCVLQEQSMSSLFLPIQFKNNSQLDDSFRSVILELISTQTSENTNLLPNIHYFNTLELLEILDDTSFYTVDWEYALKSTRSGRLTEACDTDNCLECDSECTKCHLGFYLSDGECLKCSENCEVYDEDCQCLDCKSGYFLDDKNCFSCPSVTNCNEYNTDCSCKICAQSSDCSENCKKYYSSSSLSAFFNLDYTKVIITFDTPPQETVEVCTELIEIDYISLLGKDPICDWADQSLKIYLGEGYTLKNNDIKLKPLESKDKECSDTPEVLNVEVHYKYPFPEPQFYFEADNPYSLSCSDEDLRVSIVSTYGICNNKLSYKWEVVSDSGEFVQFTENLSSILIKKQDLSQGNYMVTATVTNIYDRSSTKSYEISVKETGLYKVKINSPENIKMVSSDQREFVASVPAKCGSPTIVWEFVKTEPDNSPIDASTVLTNSKYPNKLEILRYDLKGGFTYIFKASASSEEAYGESLLYIQVGRSDLVVQINRGNGSIPNTKDLVLNAYNSYDPDDPSNIEPIIFVWSCFEENKECKDSEGKRFIANEITDSITISKEKLRAGRIYKFILEANKTNRISTDEVILEVIDKSDCEISIQKPTSKINPQKEVIIKANVSTSQPVLVMWKQVQGNPLEIASSSDIPYLRIGPNSLKPGSKYTFEAYLNEHARSEVTIFTSVQPHCTQGLTVYSETEHFRLSLVDCADNDRDYPLSYSFGFNWKSFYCPLMPLSYANSIQIKLPHGQHKCIGIVCDTTGTCSSYTKTVDSISDIRAEDIKDVNDDLVPMHVFLCAISQNLKIEDWEILFEYLKAYAEDEELMDEFMGSSIITASSALVQVELINNTQRTKVIDLLLFTIDKLNGKLSETNCELLIDTVQNINTEGDRALLAKTQILLKKMLMNHMKDVPPTDTHHQFQSSGILADVHRTTGKYINNMSSNTRLYLPSSLPFAESDVITISFTEIPGKYSSIVDLSFLNSGRFENYSLSLSEDAYYDLKDLAEPIQISFPCSIMKKEGYCCQYLTIDNEWDTTGCSLVEVSEKTCKIETFHTSLFTLLPSEIPECETGYIPIYCLSVMFGISGLLLFLSDGEAPELDVTPQSIKVYSMDSSPEYPEERSQEIVVFNISCQEEEMVSPEINLSEQPSVFDNVKFVDEEEYIYSFVEHHLFFGQMWSYYYPKQFRTLFLLLDCLMTFALNALLMHFTRNFLIISIVSTLVCVKVISLLEYLVTRESKNMICEHVGVTSLIIIFSSCVVYANFTNCEEENVLWTVSALSTLFVNLFLVQSLVAAIKLIFLNV